MALYTLDLPSKVNPIVLVEMAWSLSLDTKFQDLEYFLFCDVHGANDDTAATAVTIIAIAIH